MDSNKDTKETEQGIKKPKSDGKNVGTSTQQRVLRATRYKVKQTLKILKKIKKKLIKRQDRMLSTIKEPINTIQIKLSIIPRKQL